MDQNERNCPWSQLGLSDHHDHHHHFFDQAQVMPLTHDSFFFSLQDQDVEPNVLFQQVLVELPKDNLQNQVQKKQKTKKGEEKGKRGQTDCSSSKRDELIVGRKKQISKQERERSEVAHSSLIRRSLRVKEKKVRGDNGQKKHGFSQLKNEKQLTETHQSQDLEVQNPTIHFDYECCLDLN